MTSEVKGYLGFANLPNQVHRKSVKKGFEFTLMVVGESGLGKSTLVNCLFYSQLYKNRKIPMVQDTLESTVKITASTVDIEERGVKLKLTVVDTPGYGEGIDSKDCTEPIISYIDDQYEKYLQHESGLNRRQIADTRIHCCFYFISPVGYGLKPIDVHFLKRLHKKVNIIPLIGKSDALTKEEIKVLKKNILAEIEANEISIYTIPDADEDEEEDFKEQIKQVKASIPFAVSSSLDSHEVKGRKVQGRLYPWGVVETENPDHSDFVKLRSLLVTHMQDLREVTQEVHYENYRSLRLAGGGLSGANSGVISMDNISLNQSEDGEETSRMLQEKEAELRRMEEMLAKMRQQMQQQGFQQEDHCNGQGMNGSTRV